jgi:hypothetical protein
MNENHKVLFSIHHLNGVYNKTIENTDRTFGADLYLVDKKSN